MKEKKKRILAGLVAGSALSLTLALDARAEEMEPTDDSTPTTQTDGGAAAPASQVEGGSSTTPESGIGKESEKEDPAAEKESGEDVSGNEKESEEEASGNEEASEEEASGNEEASEEEASGNEEASEEEASGNEEASEEEASGNEEASEDAAAGGEEVSVEASAPSPSQTNADQDANYTQRKQTDCPVTVGGFDLSDQANASAGWNEDDKSGWRYDGSSVCMVNNGNAVDVRSESGNVSLSVAGFNRISTLYANDNVNITGTGILLIDNIDLLEGKNLNLLANTNVYEDGAGSAAVFLKNENGEYVLINGSVKGLLDEEYTIPDGVTLVVPEGGILDMKVTTTVKTETTVTEGSETTTYEEVFYGFTQEDEDTLDAFAGPITVEEEGSGEDYYKVEIQKELSFSVPVLNISSGALLRLHQGSQLLMDAFRFQMTVTQNFAIDAINASSLNVYGTLELGGEVKATSEGGTLAENLLVSVGSGGSITGVETETGTVTGTLADATVVYAANAGNQDELNISGSNSYVKASGSGIGQLNVSGQATVVCDDGASIGGVTAESGSLVRFAGTARDARYEVGNLCGQYAVDSGYLTANGSHANEVFTDPGAGVGTGSVSVITSGFRGTLVSTPQFKYWTGSNTALGPAAPQEWTEYKFAYTPGQQVSFDSLSGSSSWGGFDYYEVYTYDSATGLVQLHLMRSGSTEAVDADQILQIRGVDYLDADSSSLTVDGQYLSGAASSGWNGSSGWRYNGSTVTMVNNSTANSIYAEATGVELNVAGLNRIGLLYADGDVNITGTGIVLIDNIDLLYGKKLNLLTNRDLYENGSAAVFLKNANGDYELINGSIPGILDEEYTIPEGVTLVLPDGSVLELRVTSTATDSAGNTQTSYGASQSELKGSQPSFSVPVLNIAGGAAVKVESGAQLRLDAFRFREGNSQDYTINTSAIRVAGLLTLDGSITRFGSCGGSEGDNLLLRVENGGRVTGSGSLTDATVIYEAGAGSQDSLTLAGKSYLLAGSSGIGSVTAAGDTTVICADGVRLGTVTATGTGKVTFAGTQRANRYTVDLLEGSYRVESGYLTANGSYIGDHASAAAPSNPIPVEKVTLGGTHITDVSHLDFWTGVAYPTKSNRPTDTSVKETTIKYTDSGSVGYAALRRLDQCAGYAYYEVYSLENGKLTVHLLSADSAETVPLNSIVKIVAVDFEGSENRENGIYVDHQQLSGSNNSGWTAGSGSNPGSGWRYDGSSVSMVNNGKPVDIQSVGGGVDLSVAGLNLVGILKADEDVNITGTGLILIDRIDLAQEKKLNLKTNKDVYQDGEGSAAVFLYDPESGCYKLINGTVPGILDEAYTIPDGVTLVVPQGGVLDLRTTTQVTTTITSQSGGAVVGEPETHYGITDADRTYIDALDEPITYIQDGQECYMRKELTVSKASLTVPDSSILKVENGGRIKLESLFIEVTGSYNKPYRYRANCALNLNGQLELNGTVERTGNVNVTAEVNIYSTGKVSGTGTMSGVRVNFPEKNEGNLLHIVGDGIKLDVEANEIRSIEAVRATSVFFRSGASIGNVSTSGTGTITFFALSDPHDRLDITTSCSGACTINSGCVYVGGNYHNESFTNPGANVGTNIPIQAETNNKAIVYSNPTATAYGFTYITKKPDEEFTFSQSKLLPLENEVTFTYDYLSPAVSDSNVFEIFVCDTTTNKVTVYIVDEKSSVKVKAVTDDAVYLMENINGIEVQAGKVFLIRGLNQNIYPNTEFNGSNLDPGTSNTGSGILGGEGAGSLNGGNPNSVLTGNRRPGNSENGSGSVSNTDTSNTGSGILVGGGSLNGSNSSPILPGSGTRPEEPADNGSVSNTDTSNTGSGVLGDGGSLQSGSATSVLAGSRQPAAPDSTINVELRVTDLDGKYNLSMYYNGIELTQLGGGTVHVTMKATLDSSWSLEDLFAVFRDENGNLTAVKVTRNSATGMLEFDSPVLGDFQLVCFHWEGTDYTDPDFLAALKDHMNG